jgi:excisionase family DNA binding protein
MSTAYAIPTTVRAPQQDRDEIQQLKQLLNNTDASHPKLVDPHGREIPLPDSVYEALKNVVQAMASGQAIMLVPTEHELTTQEAADLLNVSRPYLVKLLDQGDIPCVLVGKHRRVRFQDLMHYKQHRAAERRQNLSDLTEFLQKEGFYDYDRESSDCI